MDTRNSAAMTRWEAKGHSAFSDTTTRTKAWKQAIEAYILDDDQDIIPGDWLDAEAEAAFLRGWNTVHPPDVTPATAPKLSRLTKPQRELMRRINAYPIEGLSHQFLTTPDKRVATRLEKKGLISTDWNDGRLRHKLTDAGRAVLSAAGKGSK